MNDCTNCYFSDCELHGTQNQICHKYKSQSNKIKESFTQDELKTILSLLRSVNSIDGDVNMLNKLRDKTIRMIGE